MGTMLDWEKGMGVSKMAYRKTKPFCGGGSTVVGVIVVLDDDGACWSHWKKGFCALGSGLPKEKEVFSPSDVLAFLVSGSVKENIFLTGACKL